VVKTSIKTLTSHCYSA